MKKKLKELQAKLDVIEEKADKVEKRLEFMEGKSQNTEWLSTQESVDVFTSIMITDYPQAEKNHLWEVELEKHNTLTRHHYNN